MENEKQEQILLSQDNISSQDKFTLSFEFKCPQPSFGYATVIIPAAMVDLLYDETARAQQHSVHAYGFNRGQVPIEYIKQNFETNILEHMKEFFFKYSVLNTLFREIRTKKIPVASEPRLTQIIMNPQKDGRFIFELSLSPKIDINDWKYLPFKAPKRKNYKDLDRQVEFFMKEERAQLKNTGNNGLKVGDWVQFDIALVDEEEKSLFGNHSENFWFKIGDEEVDNPIRELFLDKEEGDIFHTTNRGLQQYFSGKMNTIHKFRIKILNTVSHVSFCFDLFKKHFKLKTNNDVNKKLIEIFSYRNDLSQRRSMVEEASCSRNTK